MMASAHAAVRRRPLISVVPTDRLALAVAAAALLWLVPGSLGTSLSLGALAAILVAAAVDFVLLPSRGAVELTREIPESIGLGEAEPVRYRVRSLARLPLRLSLVDLLPAAVRGSGASEVRLPAGGTAEIPFEITGVVRGRWALGEVGVRATTRLGLLAKRFVFRPADGVLVVPSVANVRRFRLLALQHRLHDAGIRVLRRRGEGRSFASLREYVVGDDPRHIDWKATGKRQKLITREFTIEQAQTVFTLIDAGRSMTQLSGEYARFEHALSAALVLTDVAATAGDRVGTLVFDDEIRAFVPAHRGRAALGAVRDALVPVTASLAEPDYAAAFRLFATKQRKRALVVFFTDVIDLRASRALLAQLGGRASRHLVVVVALRNDELFAIARGAVGAGVDRPPHAVSSAAMGAAGASAVRETKDRLYTAAAAEELLQAREEALERMRRLGVTVIDVSPQHMTAAVVNKYLEIKSRGTL